MVLLPETEDCPQLMAYCHCHCCFRPEPPAGPKGLKPVSVRPRHPAKFTPSVLDAIQKLLPPSALVLDPFAGTGLIHELDADTVGVEIQPEWANLHPDTIVGNALLLPFRDESFDVVATSPCFGNRYADHHVAHDGSERRSYTHDLRAMTGDFDRELHPDNAGLLHWGLMYRSFHEQAWAEAYRVLKPGGVFVLNISDHIRLGKRMHVAEWHVAALVGLGLRLERGVIVPTPRMRRGQNGDARVEGEWVLRFSKRMGTRDPDLRLEPHL